MKRMRLSGVEFRALQAVDARLRDGCSCCSRRLGTRPEGNSRFPSGMTTRKARAETGAEAKEEVKTELIGCVEARKMSAVRRTQAKAADAPTAMSTMRIHQPKTTIRPLLRLVPATTEMPMPISTSVQSMSASTCVASV